MTIQRQWVEIMKTECPSAFTQVPPFRPKVAFIDGMPLLMVSERTKTWDQLVRNNFASACKRFMGIGADTVVLAFDVYQYVPNAKAITQMNRSKRCKDFEFSDASQLPTCIPLDYNDKMRNRAFKRRVIQLIIENIPAFVDFKVSSRLIIDYESCPIMYSLDPTTNKPVQSFMTQVPPMGEADVKFMRSVCIFERFICV